MVNSSPDKLGEERLSRVGNITVSCIVKRNTFIPPFTFNFGSFCELQLTKTCFQLHDSIKFEVFRPVGEKPIH